MKYDLKTKILLGVALVVIAGYFWPQYEREMPRTAAEVAQSASAAVAEIPSEVPLTLITEPDDGVGMIREAIQTAAQSLDLVIYELDDRQIEQDLVDAKNRGVAVRVILQNVNSFGKHPNQGAYDFLKSNGVPTIWAREYFTLTHQKTLIVDSERAFIMTFNLQSKYYPTSRDFGLVDGDATDVTAIEKTFEGDWNGSKVTATSGRDLLWSPGSAPTLLALIDSASTSLDIYTLEMADDRITAALKRAAARGVMVRVNMTYATNWKPALNELTLAGVRIRTFASSAKLFIHAKVIIADDIRMFIGSENFSQQSLDLNRELGILTSRPDLIDSVMNTFEKDWVGSRPFRATSKK